MKKTTGIILFSFLLPFSDLSVGAPFDVNRVYRFDSRPPEVIFKQGFKSWGDNMDLLAHISGDSCAGPRETRDSGFISTGADEDGVIDAARAKIEFLSQNMTKEEKKKLKIYVYTIEPDSRFYPAVESLQYYALHNPTYIPPILDGSGPELIQEYVRPTSINNYNIESVHIITLDPNDHPIVSDSYSNPEFMSFYTSANEMPFIIESHNDSNSDDTFICMMSSLPIGGRQEDIDRQIALSILYFGQK